MTYKSNQLNGKLKEKCRAYGDEEFNALLDFLEEVVALNKIADVR